MDDHLLTLVLLILEIFGEVLLEIVPELLISLIEHARGEAVEAPHRPDRRFTGFIFALFGIAAGLISVALFPHPLVRPSRLHGISMFVSPVVTGSVMYGIGALERGLGRKPTQIESFWMGFIFALAMAIVRFWLVR